MRTAPIVCCLTLLSACGGGDDDGGSALEGIFELESWTHNAAGCDEEGTPAFEESMYTHFFVRLDNFFGETLLNAVMCDDLDTCRTDAADTDTLFLGPFLFENGNDDDGWTGRSAILFGETCDGSVRTTVLTGEPGASIVIEQESRSVFQVGMTGEGECDDEAAYEQAEGEECEELTVVRGSFLEDI
jgi:hypothetical protein